MKTNEKRVGVLWQKRFTPAEAARELHVDERTLANWRWLKRGPSYFKAGGIIYYTAATLDEWLCGFQRFDSNDRIAARGIPYERVPRKAVTP